MRIVYLIEPRVQLSVSAWNGAVTGEEWRASLKRLLEDPSFGSVTRHLADLRLADLGSTIDEAEIRDTVDFLAPYAKLLAGRRAAILAGKEFAKAGIFEQLIARYSLTVVAFTFLDVACTWLGIEVGEAQPLLDKLRAQLVPDGPD